MPEIVRGSAAPVDQLTISTGVGIRIAGGFDQRFRTDSLRFRPRGVASGSAEGLVNDLFGSRPQCMALALGMVVEGPRRHLAEFIEWREIT